MGKTIVITGGTSGIGLVLKNLFEQNGDTVITFSLEETNSTNHYQGNIDHEIKVRQVFNDIHQRFGNIDVLINCAGIGMSGITELAEMDEIKRVMDINFYGTLYSIRSALPYMSSGSKIVNMSSAMALFPVPYRSIYGAAKSAVLNLSLSLRMELKPLGIDVIAICPGNTKTNFTKNRIKNFVTNERYGNRLENATLTSDANEDKRMTAKDVGETIFALINKPKSKPFYIVGKKYKFLHFLTRFTPKSALINQTEKHMGGHKALKHVKSIKHTELAYEQPKETPPAQTEEIAAIVMNEQTLSQPHTSPELSINSTETFGNFENVETTISTTENSQNIQESDNLEPVSAMSALTSYDEQINEDVSLENGEDPKENNYAYEKVEENTILETNNYTPSEENIQHIEEHFPQENFSNEPITNYANQNPPVEIETQLSPQPEENYLEEQEQSEEQPIMESSYTETPVYNVETPEHPTFMADPVQAYTENSNVVSDNTPQQEEVSYSPDYSEELIETDAPNGYSESLTEQDTHPHVLFDEEELEEENPPVTPAYTQAQSFEQETYPIEEQFEPSYETNLNDFSESQISTPTTDHSSSSQEPLSNIHQNNYTEETVEQPTQNNLQQNSNQQHSASFNSLLNRMSIFNRPNDNNQ